MGGHKVTGCRDYDVVIFERGHCSAYYTPRDPPTIQDSCFPILGCHLFVFATEMNSDGLTFLLGIVVLLE